MQYAFISQSRKRYISLPPDDRRPVLRYSLPYTDYIIGSIMTSRLLVRSVVIVSATLLLLLQQPNGADSAKILCLFPTASKSHVLGTQALLKNLAQRGHEVRCPSTFAHVRLISFLLPFLQGHHGQCLPVVEAGEELPRCVRADRGCLRTRHGKLHAGW